jgi:acetylornithine aminotransferase
VSDAAPTGFEPGDHASTFGGNPVACAAACASSTAIDDSLLAHVRAIVRPAHGGPPRSSARYAGLAACCSVELDRPAAPVVEAALQQGLVIGSAGPNTLRLTPPLTITADEARLRPATAQEVIS